MYITKKIKDEYFWKTFGLAKDLLGIPKYREELTIYILVQRIDQ